MECFIHDNNIGYSDNILIQVFTGIVEVEFIKNIISEIQSLLPKAEVIGATTAGEIYKGKVMTNTTIISFTIFTKSAEYFSVPLEQSK
jgi:hypothetical protein